MKKTVTLSTVLLLSSPVIYAQCNPNSSNIYSFTTNGITYEVIKENLNWTEASACAVHRNGKLVEINSQLEQDSVFFYVNEAGIVAFNTEAPDGGGASYVWIGGNDLTTEGTWVWNGDNTGSTIPFWQGDFSGSPIGGAYNNWGNEPDDFSGQDALGLAITDWPLGVAGEWNDVDHTNNLYFVIELVDQTSLEDLTAPNLFSLYPNPASHLLTIQVENPFDHFEITVCNLLGANIMQLTNETSIDISSLASGTYTLTLNQNGHSATQLFTVE